jgi:UDP-glucose 4-epimerase
VKILITGNSGYIGSHLSKMLINNSNYKLYGLDKNQNQQIKLPYFYEWDITMEGSWGFDEEFDCIVHLAAEVAVGRSVTNPILYYATNTLGTLNLLRNIRTKRFVHASTGSAGPMNNPYGISKRAAEEIVAQWCSQNNIPYTTFRFFNVTGCDEIHPTNPDGLMWNLINAEKTGVFTVFGDDYNTKDGTPVRDYTHVNEICLAVSKAIEVSSNNIENLGHGVGTTVLEMVDLYKKINNCEFDVKIGPRREGDLEKSVLDNPSSYMQKLYTMEDLLYVSR